MITLVGRECVLQSTSCNDVFFQFVRQVAPTQQKTALYVWNERNSISLHCRAERLGVASTVVRGTSR